MEWIQNLSMSRAVERMPLPIKTRDHQWCKDWRVSPSTPFGVGTFIALFFFECRQRDDKPGSVEGVHFSTMLITQHLQQPTRR